MLFAKNYEKDKAMFIQKNTSNDHFYKWVGLHNGLVFLMICDAYDEILMHMNEVFRWL